MANAIFLSYIQLNVIMLIAIMLSTLMVNVFVIIVNASILSVILANAIILSVIMLMCFKVNVVVPIAALLSFYILSATSVVRQNVARLIVVAPNGGHPSKLTHRRTQLFFLILYLPFIVIPSVQSKLAAKQRSILSVCHFHPSLMF
jgi:hypothetical protein